MCIQPNSLLGCANHKLVFKYILLKTVLFKAMKIHSFISQSKVILISLRIRRFRFPQAYHVIRFLSLNN